MIRLLLSILLSASFIMNAQTKKRVQQGAFEVVGLQARTTNIDEAGSNGVIPRLWQRLISEKLLDQIPGKIESDIIAVYTEYASDENGAYTYTVGAKVKPGTIAPEGMRNVHVSRAEYLVFPTSRGPVEKVVPAEWRVIWNAFPADSVEQRAFTADFELYSRAAANPKDSQVDIYIAVK